MVESKRDYSIDYINTFNDLNKIKRIVTNNTNLIGTNDTLNIGELYKLFKIYTTPFYKFNINKRGNTKSISNEVCISFGLKCSYHYNEMGTAFNAIYNKTDDIKQQIINELSIYNRINMDESNEKINNNLQHTNLNLRINDELNIITNNKFNNMSLKDILLNLLEQYIEYDVINIFSHSSGKYPIAEMYMIYLIRYVLKYSGMIRILFIDIIYYTNNNDNKRDLIYFLDKFRNLDFKYDILREPNKELINEFINNQRIDIQRKFNERFNIDFLNTLDVINNNNNNINNINLFFEFNGGMQINANTTIYDFIKENINALFEITNVETLNTKFDYTVNYNMRGGQKIYKLKYIKK